MRREYVQLRVERFYHVSYGRDESPRYRSLFFRVWAAFSRVKGKSVLKVGKFIPSSTEGASLFFDPLLLISSSPGLC